MVTDRTRGGFTLVEALLAVVLVAFIAVALASGEAWAGRQLAAAEAQEAAAAAAELVLDSLAQAPNPTSGATVVGGLALQWTVQPAGGGARVRLRVRDPAGRQPDEEYGALLAPPPPSLGSSP